MTTEFVAQFDRMCAGLHSGDDRTRAACGEWLTQIRDSERPLDACLEIVDAPCADLTRSTAALILRQALVRIWATLSEAEVVDIRVKLLNRVVAESTPRGVRLQLIETAALLIKRTWFVCRLCVMCVDVCICV